MILVTGGSASGKSAYAESLLTDTEEGGTRPGIRYYIATMRVYDDEDRARVEKHRRMREGKNFIIIEQPTDLIGALGKIRAGAGQMTALPVVALVESISNLAANEMFREDVPETENAFSTEEPSVAVADRIVRQVTALDDALDGLVVVTDNVFEDGTEYEPATMEYLRTLGEINRRLADRAWRVVEVVAGIPVVIKDSDHGGMMKG